MAFSTKFYADLASIMLWLVCWRVIPLLQKQHSLHIDWSWNFDSVLLSNFMLSKKYSFKFLRFPIRIIKKVSWSILRFAVDWTWTLRIFLNFPRKVTVVNSSDVNCVFQYSRFIYDPFDQKSCSFNKIKSAQYNYE